MKEQELFWDEEFEWIDNEPLSDEEAAELPLEQILEREHRLVILLGAYANRWVEVENGNVIRSATTLRELILKRPNSEIMYTPATREGFFVGSGNSDLKQAA